MGQPGNKIKIDLPEKEAIAGLFKVKPAPQMPRHTQAAKKRNSPKRPILVKDKNQKKAGRRERA